MAQIDGTPGADALTGTSSNDIINGLGGNDVIEGGAGDDTINGGDGDDTITDSAGSDTIDAGAGNDRIELIRYDLNATPTLAILAGDGNDYVHIWGPSTGSASVDLGAGNDELVLDSVPQNQSYTLGAGIDIVKLGTSAPSNAPKITDFQAGAGGDIADLSDLLNANPFWNHSSNPFSGLQPYLKLEQQGSDAVLLYNSMPSFGGSSATIMTFQGTTAAQFTADNFGGFDPAGGGVATVTYEGTSGDDVKFGASFNDTLNGNGGNDRLDGGNGDDTINGGDGDDWITDPWGSDTINGGAGNDDIAIVRPFSYSTTNLTITGGTGNDIVHLKTSGDGSVSVDLGAGDDRLILEDALSQTQTFTLGAGVDTVELTEWTHLSQKATITDFQTGAGGDVVDMVAYLQQSLGGWDPDTNPFTGGHLVLVQAGADVLLKTGVHDWDPTFLTFQNTTVAAFTAENFAGYDPTGVPPASVVFNGGSGDDVKDGAGGDDTLNGNGGNDTLDGKSGNDIINGGDGNDTLNGWRGNDVIHGNDGDDTLTDGSGSNWLYGDAGNDSITFGYIYGTLPVGQTNHAFGGSGDDHLTYDAVDDSVLIADMGDGNDVVTLNQQPGSTTLTLGAGADIIELYPYLGVFSLNGPVITDFTPGAGGDKLIFSELARNNTWPLETDVNYNPFAYDDASLVQSGADTVLIFRDSSVVMTFLNTNAADFTADNFDADPKAPILPGVTLDGSSADDVLTGTRRADVINGLGGNDTIDGGGRGADTLSGGDGNDTITGGKGQDTINGDAGDDVLDGASGIDHINGGDGNDLIYYSDGLDVIDGGAGNDRLSFARVGQWNYGDFPAINLDLTGFKVGPFMPGGNPGGTFLLSGHLVVGVENIEGLSQGTGSGDHILFDSADTSPHTFFSVGGDDDIRGGAGIDHFEGGDGNDQLYGLAGDDYLEGDAGNDLLDAGDGNDMLQGGIGNDQLIGGAGDDELWSAEGNDTLDGGAGNDKLYAGDGTDVMNAGDGDDLLSFIGFDAGDAAHGGAGDDRLQILNALNVGLDLDFRQYWTTGLVAVAGGTAAASGIEHFEFRLGDAADRVLLGEGAPEGVNITAYGGNDIILGTGFADTIDGGTGNDQLSGGGGDDIIIGDGISIGEVNVLDGGDGNDTITGSGTLIGGAGNDSLSGGYYADILDSGTGDDIIQGFSGDDLILIGANSGIDRIDGNFGADTIKATADDVLIHWTVERPGEASSLNIVTGIEAILADGHSNFRIVGTDQADNMALTSTENLMFGSAAQTEGITVDAMGGDDTIVGGAGNDILIGGSGNDEIKGLGGVDLLYGGSGNDTFYATAGDIVFENSGEGTDTVNSSADFYLFANIENLTLNQGAGDIFGVGNELDNVIVGNEGQNLIIGWDGNDEIHGGAARDALFGVDGNDHIYGDAGIDYIVAGAGDDVIDGGADEDEIYGQDGNDIIYGGSDFKTDIIVAGAGNDIIHGDSGLGEMDWLYGNEGNDTFYVDTPFDLVFEQPGEGTDTVYAGIDGAGYYLYDNIENLVLTGNTPFGVGNALDNHLTGSQYDNWLLGGGGNDVLDGGAGGIDVLFGESGADTFKVSAGFYADIIGDFTPGEDKVDLSALHLSWNQVQSAMDEISGTGFLYFDNDTAIIFLGVPKSGLHQADFIL